MAPQRTNANATPFGKFLDVHNISYAEAARELGVTRERIRQLAQRCYPSLLTCFTIEDWTRTIDPKAAITADDWRIVVLSSSEAKEQLTQARTTQFSAAPPPRSRSRLSRK